VPEEFAHLLPRGIFERIEPGTRGKIGLDGVTHSSPRRRGYGVRYLCARIARLRLQRPYDDQVGAEGHIRTWQNITAW
jgi:hypothetical protein